jgi:hypothetical protein
MIRVMGGDGGSKGWAGRVESATGAIVGVALAGEVVLLPFVALVWFVYGDVAVGICASVASPLAVFTIVHMIEPRRLTWPFAAALTALHVALVLWVVATVAWWLRHARALGFDADEAAFLLFLATVAGFVAVRVAWSLRHAPGRLGQVALTSALALAGLTAVTAIAAPVSAAVSGSSCRWFHPSSERWAMGASLKSRFGSTDRERMTAALARCDTLTGASRAEVRRLLGQPASTSGPDWSYVIAEERYLDVVFREDGQVTRLVASGADD